MADLMKEAQKLDKLISKNSVNFDDIIIKTLEKSSNFTQLKNISINTLLTTNKNEIDKSGEITQILKNAEKQEVQVEPDRLGKYQDYEDLVNKLPIVGASVNTLVDNIITPDNNFKKIFKYSYDFSDITPEYKSLLTSFNNITNKLDFENLADEMSRSLVMYGCYFVEIVDTKKQLYQYKVLQDSDEKFTTPKINTFEKHFVLTENDDKSIDLIDFNEEYSILLEATKDPNAKIPEDMQSSFEQIKLNNLNPKNVVVVYSSDVILGYLVIIPTPGNIAPNEKLAKDILEKLFQDSNIPNLKKLLDANPQYESYLSNLLNSYDTGISDIKARFVPVDSMIHEFIGGNFPYGVSRLEQVRTLGKYAIIGNASNMLYRFTRAPDLRLFKIDVGMDHDSAKYIQQIKGELMQRKYAVDWTQNVDTLTKQLTQFEDLWVPTKQGQEFFSIEVLPSGDLQSKNDDLKFLQDQIINGLDTPPTYLGVERGDDSRYTLSQMNAKFAKTIQRLSKVVSRGLDKALKQVYRKSIGDNALLDNVRMSLYPPTALLIERMSEIYSNVSTVMQSLETLKLPQEYFLKELIPWIDENDLDEATIKQKIQDITNASKGGGDEDEDGGGGDLF